VIAAVALLAAFACGCGGQDAVDPSGSLVSEAGQIAFTSEGIENDSEIYVMNSDGSGLTRLTNSSAEDAFPAWRPRVR
jgi:Tol biopolymer transport system component